MEYRKATIEEAKIVRDIVQERKAIIYPHYYTQAVVDFFGRLHSIDNIKKDIAAGSRTDNHITRVYVLPEHVGKGFGSVIMDRLEEEIFKEYDDCYLDASLPAAIFYEHRGYCTVEHRKHDIGDGEVMIYEIMRKEKGLKVSGGQNE